MHRSNPYCDALGIGIPKLEVAKDHPEANYYRLLIVFLLERGEPVTLQEAAERFEEAGVAPAAQALASLQRCKPARAPIYRDGDYYALDPHDAETDLSVWRLGLRPSEAAPLPVDGTAELGRMRRVLVHAVPARRPEAVVLVDVAERAIHTFVGDEIGDAVERLAAYDIIAAIDVRTLLRTLRFEPGDRRLGELGPPQKTKKISKSGRTLKITTSLLVQGSCGIRRPFGDEKTMREYLAGGELTKLRRRLEADAKSLYAIYQYGRLHGTVRLRWGFLDEPLPAPWVHDDEVTLHRLMDQSRQRGVPLQVVVGTAPGWADPWSRAQLAHVDEDGWRLRLVDDDGYVIPRDEIQLARLSGAVGIRGREQSRRPAAD